MILLLIGMLALSGGVYVAMDNASIARRQVQANVRRASSYAVIETNEADGELTKSANERLVLPMLRRFSQLAMRMSPAGKRAELLRKIRAAGLDINPQVLLGFKAPTSGSTVRYASAATRWSAHCPTRSTCSR